MEPRDLLSVSTAQTLQFFVENLKDVSESAPPPADELLYNASVLAHFASTSVSSEAEFPAAPASLSTVCDLFVLDRSQHHDPAILEAAAAQCLLLTGFFRDQMRRRYNVRWYAALGASFFAEAAHHHSGRRARMMDTMAIRFEFWRSVHHRLAIELRDAPRLLAVPPRAQTERRASARQPVTSVSPDDEQRNS